MNSKPVDLMIAAPRPMKQALMVAADLILIPIAIFLSFLFSTGYTANIFSTSSYTITAITTFCSVALFVQLGLYHAVVRFMGNEALIAVVKGVTFSSLIFALLISASGSDIPLTSPFIYFSIALGLIGFTRLSARQLISRQTAKGKINVAIYGAGSSGLALLVSLRNSNKYNPVALIDDRTRIRNMRYNGLKVCSPESLPSLIQKHGIEQVLLAMPSITSTRKKEIIIKLEPMKVRIRTVPSMESLVSGKARLEQIQDICVEDLLKREPVNPIPALLQKCIVEKTVLVTGAGGSIGSELCRQILTQKPEKLILVERCEMALYQIDQELCHLTSTQGIDTKVVPLLACAQNSQRMQTIFNTFAVDTVYHAAAYKHVPLVEFNMVEGVRNNVFGTYETALAAQNSGVANFVLISTDKAVRPTNIMGASKRLAELVLQSLAQGSSKTRFSMVRFGNVLGSSGSVVPLFRKQIASGGPITVTHEDVIRYFMTIPEASQLVIQAGAMASGGDVFLLDMGEPVKISELAETMIRLLGLTVKNDRYPSGDIEIKYTGLRPGEKLFEELLVGSHALSTQHSQIMRAEEQSHTLTQTRKILEELNIALNDGNCVAIQEILLDANTGYTGSKEISDLVWIEGAGNFVADNTSDTLKKDNIAYLTR
ncbi:MAG: polysaccharide biosynthesis protein [Pseudomonadales bacterium]|nr:polysaccharide biosynthesis protein [Pseudomonadales bacterium]